MNRKFYNKKYLMALIAGVVLLAFSVFAYFLNADEITMNVNQMVANAQRLYEKGDFENAYYQLQLYCQENSADSEAWTLLGDLCSDTGDDEGAISYYKKAANLVKCSENQLGENDKIKTFRNFQSIKSIKIYPTVKYTKGMTLNISGDSFIPKSQEGKITNKPDETDGDKNYLTTEWFSVDDSYSSVYITGDINYGFWQFADESGNCTNYKDTADFRISDSASFVNMPFSTAKIPKNAVKARVTYYDKSISTNVQSNGELMVGYGDTLTGYTGVKNRSFNIPDLSGDRYVQYDNGEWSYFDGEKVNKLDWEALGCSDLVTLSLQGELCGTVEVSVVEDVKKEADKSLKYGIKYSRNSGVSSCERLSSARGMSFDYMVGDEWKFSTGNDFDKAYPWCEMELCNVDVNSDGTEKVTLQGEAGFKTDGSNGNVMVRIPKFYSKRVVENDYEYIWISGTEHEGYDIEPVFVNDNGSVAEYVYVSAYLGAEDDEKIISAAGYYPIVNMEYGTTLEYAENNGSGFSEMNYLMCAALQKLFVIETGTIDSSSIFAGESSLYYNAGSSPEETVTVAETAVETNRIVLYNNFYTDKLQEGSYITVFDEGSGYDNTSPRREITEIKSDEDYMYITFDGEPLSVKKHVTCISNIPSMTGKTDIVDYCSGTLEGNDGTVGFKYRNIENLYGSAFVMLDDDAYVMDGIFSFYSGGRLNRLSTPIATQDKDLNNWDYANIMCIKEMTYDVNYPQIMLPYITGNGANVYNYYGDVWFYQHSSDIKKFLVYGGALDKERLGGIFQMYADIDSYEKKSDCFSARIMYR